MDNIDEWDIYLSDMLSGMSNHIHVYDEYKERWGEILELSNEVSEAAGSIQE